MNNEEKMKKIYSELHLRHVLESEVYKEEIESGTASNQNESSTFLFAEFDESEAIFTNGYICEHSEHHQLVIDYFNDLVNSHGFTEEYLTEHGDEYLDAIGEDILYEEESAEYDEGSKLWDVSGLFNSDRFVFSILEETLDAEEEIIDDSPAHSSTYIKFFAKDCESAYKKVCEAIKDRLS